MTKWDVIVTANTTFHTHTTGEIVTADASFHITIEAESFNEAYRKAKQIFVDSDRFDIEFIYPNIHVIEQ